MSHISVDDNDENFSKKIEFLSYMINKLLYTVRGKRELDDRDHWGNKRIDLASNLLGSLFRSSITRVMKTIKMISEKYVSIGKSINLNDIKKDIITKDIRYALSTGNWGVNKQNIGLLLEDKARVGYSKIPTILPTAPRILTQAQIYTINEIIKNKDKNTSYRGKAPTASDTFALIPIRHNGMKTGDLYVEFSGSLQDNKRVYFGPVDIDRMKIKLLDDKGFVVDLHGSEWCITIISENLYQY
ncbi:MAG: hypothetical protein EBS19_15625 [Spirochaetia bacterium]|nr:hypothetical protein [Spirochaetia bacterium]